MIQPNPTTILFQSPTNLVHILKCQVVLMISGHNLAYPYNSNQISIYLSLYISLRIHVWNIYLHWDYFKLLQGSMQVNIPYMDPLGMVSCYQPLLTTTNHSPLEIFSAPGEQIWDVASQRRCTSSSPGGQRSDFFRKTTPKKCCSDTSHQSIQVYIYIWVL